MWLFKSSFIHVLFVEILIVDNSKGFDTKIIFHHSISAKILDNLFVYFSWYFGKNVFFLNRVILVLFYIIIIKIVFLNKQSIECKNLHEKNYYVCFLNLIIINYLFYINKNEIRKFVIYLK